MHRLGNPSFFVSPFLGANEGLHAGTGGHAHLQRRDLGTGQRKREEAEEHGGRDDPIAGGNGICMQLKGLFIFFGPELSVAD